MSSQGSSSSSTDALSETYSSDTGAEIHPVALTFAPYDAFTTGFPLDTSPVPTSPRSPAYIRGARSSPDDFGLDKAELLTTDQQEALAPKLTRPRTCYVYNHMPDVDPETKYRSKINGQLEWRCKYCPKRYALNGGTRCMKSHLQACHDIYHDSPRAEKVKKRQRSIEEAIAYGAESTTKRRRLENTTVIDDNDAPICPQTLEVLYINMLAACNLPTSFVEQEDFRTLIQYLSPYGAYLLPDSHSKVHGWLMNQFEAGKKRAKEILLSSTSMIHLSTDLWTSPNRMAVVGVVAHFVSKDGDLLEMVLAMKKVKGEHTGVNIANYILETIEDYRITANLGYVQMDNASNNDTMIREISHRTLLLLIWPV